MVVPIVVQVLTKTRKNNIDNFDRSYLMIFLFLRPKDKTFRWKFEGDETVRLSSMNNFYPVRYNEEIWTIRKSSVLRWAIDDFQGESNVELRRRKKIRSSCFYRKGTACRLMIKWVRSICIRKRIPISELDIITDVTIHQWSNQLSSE